MPQTLSLQGVLHSAQGQGDTALLCTQQCLALW